MRYPLGGWAVARRGPKGYRSTMFRSFAVLMLVLQARPFVGAAVCLHQALANDQKCEMAMPGTDRHKESVPHAPGTAPTPRSSADCPLAQLCAVPAGAVLFATAPASIATTEAVDPVPPYTDTLLAADPTAPLVPPPNS